MRKFFLLSALVVFLASGAIAQTSYPGKVVIKQDSRIAALVAKHRALGEKGKTDGYRVQIFFDSGNNSKNRAAAKKGQFIASYPGVGAYLTYQTPNFKVRVGDFRCRLDAEGFKAKIIGDFPDAFVVKDEINYPDL